MYYKLHGTVM